jgi:hypothetical protein
MSDNTSPIKAYDTPGLTPVEFFTAVMGSTHLSLSVRMSAAKALSLFPPYSNQTALAAISPVRHPLQDKAA